MIYRCKKCNAAVVYSAEEKKLCCEYCGAQFLVSEYEAEEPTDGTEKNSTTSESTAEEERYMQMNVCRCTACGSELFVNSAEISTYCAYCGQPTVIMDRVEMYQEPDCIIPFSVTQQEAERIIRDKFRAGYFVPEEIKNFKTEKIRGIYVPFLLYDMNYTDMQDFRYTVSSGKSSTTYYAFEKGGCQFRRFPIDASKQLDDDSSQRLEPYDFKKMVRFDASYLSGFYADKRNDGNKKTLVRERAKELFDAEMLRKLDIKGAECICSYPEIKFTKCTYVLLPVWFLSFQSEGASHTIMVNGQTAKMVGAVPFVKPKVYGLFAIAATLVSLIASPILSGLFYLALEICVHVDDDDSAAPLVWLFFGLCILCGFVWKKAIKTRNAIHTSISLTESESNNKYMKERQDR